MPRGIARFHDIAGSHRVLRSRQREPSTTGLSQADAAKRLEAHGPNAVADVAGHPRQVQTVLVRSAPKVLTSYG